MKVLQIDQQKNFKNMKVLQTNKKNTKYKEGITNRLAAKPLMTHSQAPC